MVIAWFQKMMWRILVIVLLLFAVYSSVRKTLVNSHLSEEIRQNDIDIEQQQLYNRQLELQLYYFQSPEYQEVEARSRLGLKKPDETVLAIKGLSANPKNSLDSTQYFTTPSQSNPTAKSNIVRWWEYFFKK